MTTQFVEDLRTMIANRPVPAIGQVKSDAGAWVEGRGIVTAFGGQRAFTCGYVLLRLLREELGCSLPIEVWHFGEGELTPTMRHLLAPLDVTLVDARGVLDAHPADIHDGWQLKPYAILHSRFEEVVFLDADQVPVGDPAAVFEWDAYAKSGAVFWPDIVDFRSENGIWDLLGLEARSDASFETGQIVVDKRRHWKSLALAVALNERSEIVYQHIYGDKDTFLMAWLLDGADYAFVPHRPYQTERCLVQRDFKGDPVFQHRTNAKWIYAGRQVQFAGEVHHDACLRYLADLEMGWNGELFYPPDRSERAIAAELALSAQGAFCVVIVGDRREKWEFLYPNEFGEGRSFNRRNWFVEERDTELVLQIISHGQVSYEFTAIDALQWQGFTMEKPGESVMLIAEDAMSGETSSNMLSERSPLIDGVVEASGVLHSHSLEARQALSDALTLLLRAQPSLRGSLKALLKAEPDLASVAEHVLARVPESGSRSPQRPGELFQSSYQNWRLGKP